MHNVRHLCPPYDVLVQSASTLCHPPCHHHCGSGLPGGCGVARSLRPSSRALVALCCFVDVKVVEGLLFDRVRVLVTLSIVAP